MEMIAVDGQFTWQSYSEEPASSSDGGTFTENALLEQVNATKDSSDYLWYMTE